MQGQGKRWVTFFVHASSIGARPCSGALDLAGDVPDWPAGYPATDIRGADMEEITQRILPLPREEWTDPAREVFSFWGEPNSWEEGSKTSIMMTMANHPDLGQAYNVWGKHILVTNTVPIRPREIIILRVGWNLKSEYEWHNHVGYALTAGMTLDEIAAVRTGPDAESWSEEDRAVLTSVDELMQDGRISNATWATLSKYYNKQQLMDIVFCVGHYVMTGWAMSTFGVPLEEGADVIGFDLKTKSGRTPGKTYKPGETDDWIESRGY